MARVLTRVLKVEQEADVVLHLEYTRNISLLTWYFPRRLWYALSAVRTDYNICSRSGMRH